VGGGPAGLEAARIATLRGHKVTVFEKSNEIGGAILYCCTVHGKNKMKWYADWLRRQISNLGVEVKYETVPKAADLKGFDAVLVSTGSRVVRPDIPGIDSDRVCTFQDVLRCQMKNCEYWPKGGKPEPVKVGDTVLIWGDYYAAVDAAEKLGTSGKKIIIVTRNREFGSWVEPCHRDIMVKRFRGEQGEGLSSKTFEHPVTIIPSSSVLSIGKDGEVVLIDGKFERSTVKVDNLILADVEKNDDLYQEYRKAGLVVSKIGDAKQVRNLRGAVTDGANVGLALNGDLRLNANGEIIAELPTDPSCKV
jgi:NADPH-dependent 2,4-dienoyl-CoA reductase/sulfur reductase-like enzyme